MALIEMYGREGRAHCATCIAGRRLNPNIFKCTVAQDFAIGHTVERHAPSKTQVTRTRLLCERSGQPQYNLFEHDLDRGSNVHMKGRKQFIWSTHGRAKQV